LYQILFAHAFVRIQVSNNAPRRPGDHANFVNNFVQIVLWA
jgi:hypothetical protein